MWDADAATLEVMFEHSKIQGPSFVLKVHLLMVGDDVELRVDLLTDVEDKFKSQWVDKRATIVKVGVLVHFDTDLHPDSKIE